MAISTRSTQLYFIKPGAAPTVVKVGQVVSIKGIDAPISSVDSTTLDSDHRTFTPGLAEPGTATIGMLFEPGDDVQADLHALRNAGTILQWAVGYSDGKDDPVLDAANDGEFDRDPLARSFIYFEGFGTSWEFGAEVNAVISTDVGIQLTDRPELVRAA